MPIDFPNTPTNGQTFTVGQITWTYDGEKWRITNTGVSGPQGPTGPAGPTSPVDDDQTIIAIQVFS